MAFDLAARLPWVVLFAAALVTVAAFEGVSRIEAEVDFVDTVPAHDGLEAYRALLAELDGVRFTVVYMAHDPSSGTASLRSDEGFDALVHEQRNLTEHLFSSFPEGTFSHSLSVYEGMRAGNYMFMKLATAGNAPPESYAVPEDAFTYEQVRERVRDGGSVDDVLASDGSSALLLVFFATDDDREARALAGEVDDVVALWARVGHNHPVTQEHATSGLLQASHYTDSVNRAETARAVPVAAAGVLVALVLALRRVSNALIACTTLLLALLWTYGLMGWVGVRISFLTVFLAPVVIGIGIDYAVHVLHRYEEARDGGIASRDAVALALRAIAAPIVLAALTTAAGLATLLGVSAPLFAEIGGVGAAGILIAFTASITVAPALRAVLPTRERRARRDLAGSALARVAAVSARVPALPVVLVLAALLGAAYVAGTGTTVEAGSSDNEFPQDDPVIVLQQRIEEEYGAFQRGYLVVQGDLATPEALRALHRASGRVADVASARDAASVVDFLLADARTDEGFLDVARGTTAPSADEDELPATPDEARARLDSLFDDPLWRTLAPFTISRDYRLAVVAYTLEPATGPEALRATRDALRHQADITRGELGPSYKVAAAGAPVNRAEIVDHTPQDVALATLGATGVVFLVLLVAWARRGWEGVKFAALAAAVVLASSLVVLASVPVLDAVYGNLHARGLAPDNGVALNAMFLLAFAVTVAVGVDDVVLLASRYWDARLAGHAPDRAREEAFRGAGRAVTATTLTTFTAFALMADVYFLQSKNLAILTAVGVLAAYLLTLLLAPLAMRR